MMAEVGCDAEYDPAVRVVVTGAAGFIGSHLTEALLRGEHDVVGVDSFTPYYDVARKRANVERAITNPRFELVEADLRTAALDTLLHGVDVVFHQAGQPGVRLSWSDSFALYVEHNVLATQRLLEAARGTSLRRFVFASSSSVYGNAETYPTRETDLPRPFSPYGVTKLAAEHLCVLYAANWGVPTVSLRYFTVYGPRQRPDMAFSRFLTAVLEGDAVPRYGDGEQVRDFTYVDDVVAANIAAATADVAAGTVVNVAGGSATTVNALIELMGELCGRTITVEELPTQPGDVRRTGGTVDRARELLGWEPQVGLREGIRRQLEWLEGAEA